MIDEEFERILEGYKKEIDRLKTHVTLLRTEVELLKAKVREPDFMEDAFVSKHGEAVDKTQTAKMLNVTRATVYTMLADGRIYAACNGTKVSVRSIYRYINKK